MTRHPEDVNAVGGNYETPLHASAGEGHVGIVLLLLKHLPVDIRSTFRGRPPLHDAAVGGHVEVGRLLLNRGADVNGREEDDWTPLHLAAWFGHIEFMRLLLDRGADPHARNNDGNTPSEEAGLYYPRRQDVLQFLSEYTVKSEEE
jgi:ankyrin repeat protein